MSETERKECMVDLETMGNGNRAAIMSIGACKFLPSGQGVGLGMDDRFEVFVSLESSVQGGMVVDASTVMWWMGSSCKSDDERLAMNAARDLMVANQKRKAGSLEEALGEFAKWLGKDMPVWGNGATFDNVILRNAYGLVGLPCPWSFWNDRCYRTMKNMTPNVKLQREGVHHSAMHDAVSQAKHLQQIIRSITVSGE